MLERLARTSYRRRRAVLGLWLLLLVVLGAVQGGLGSAFRTEFRLPNTESRRGFEILEEHFDAGGGDSGTVVFRAEQGVNDPAVKAAMTQMFEGVARLENVAKVTSPYTEEGAQQIASQGPQADKVAYATVDLVGGLNQQEFLDAAKGARDLIPAQPAGVQVELGGQVFAEFEPPSSEVLGLAFAIFILLIAFGSVLAMGLPIGVALFGIGTGVSLLTLSSHLLSMPDFTTTLSVMIGLGVGIDYALFIVTRYREAVHSGHGYEDATVLAIGTAGRAVLFAGITVVISLLGMILMGLSFVRGLAIGASVTVLMVMAASVTLLPALLGFAKARVEVTRYRGLIAVIFVAVALMFVGFKLPAVGLPFLVLAALTVALGFALSPLRKEVPRRAAKPVRETFWYRWSRLVQHRPWPMMLLGLGSLLLLAYPVLNLRLGFSDDGNYPEDTSTRKAYDLLADGFGPGFNGPLLITAELPAGTSLESLAPISEALAATPGVVFASPAVPNDPNQPTAALWRAIPSTSPQDQATNDLIHELRAEVIPAAAAGAGVRPALTGQVAAGIDFADYLGGRMPLFFGAVLGLSFLLLMAVFRSVLVPLKAVIVNLLSIGAAYGVVVAVFQYGWAKDLVGIGKGGPIEAWAPMMMFAIVFGLSMDYEVFLLSRMREEWDRTGDNAIAVADGLAATARVITAAAAIMVFVFGSFLLEANRQIKLFGLGLAMAVLLDATIVRMVLVPATMELLGSRNWWMPAWLDRLIPKLNVEGAPEPAPALATEHAPVD
ncbi:MAG: MMPL family transporter [Acidimicrobiales bacterium]